MPLSYFLSLMPKSNHFHPDDKYKEKTQHAKQASQAQVGSAKVRGIFRGSPSTNEKDSYHLGELS